MDSFLTSVTPADRNGTATGAAVTSFAPTATFDWDEEDILAPIAGPMASGRYVNMRKGILRTLTATWRFRTFAEVSAVFAMFRSEYVLVTYQDADTGAQKTAHMCPKGKHASATMTYADGRWEIATVILKQATPDAG